MNFASPTKPCGLPILQNNPRTKLSCHIINALRLQSMARLAAFESTCWTDTAVNWSSPHGNCLCHCCPRSANKQTENFTILLNENKHNNAPYNARQRKQNSSHARPCTFDFSFSFLPLWPTHFGIHVLFAGSVCCAEEENCSFRRAFCLSTHKTETETASFVHFFRTVRIVRFTFSLAFGIFSSCSPLLLSQLPHSFRGECSLIPAMLLVKPSGVVLVPSPNFKLSWRVNSPHHSESTKTSSC